MVILFGDFDDPHLVKVRDAYVSEFGRCEIIGTDEESLLSTVVSTCKNNNLRVSQRNNHFFVNEISGAFIFSPLFRKEWEKNQQKEFLYASWREVLYSIYDALEISGRVVNVGFRNAVSCQSKIKLKEFSDRFGLHHPVSVVTNDEAVIADFFKGKDKVAIKTLHQIYLEVGNEPAMFLTKLVNKQDFEGFSSQGESPLYLQEFVDKLYDVRVTYVGGRFYVCKIDATNSIYGKVDWRAYDLPRTIHEEIAMPNDVRVRLDGMMKAMRLDYACVDFCVDHDGVWWLLDVNPFGKYMWVELAVGLEISRGVASLIHQKFASVC
jgi:glutathione synthase/RimK-type ligase-like ATP-grasp enzyme